MKNTIMMIPFIAYFGVAILALVGWVMNIMKIVNSGFELSQWGGLEVLRVVGVFLAPLGAVLGFF